MQLHYSKETWVGIGIFLLVAFGLLIWGWLVPPASAVDDAYISYRYAANVINGIGLRFNPNEWVLGTTTPLYTLILSLLGFIQRDIPTLGHWLGLVAWVGAIGAMMGWFWQMGHRAGAVVAGLLLPLQDTMMFSVGMETPLVVALMVASGWAWWAKRPQWAVPLSAALILTRADGALWVMFAGLAAWITTRRLPWRETAGVVALTAPWFAFSWWRYGSILPNSVLAKVGQNEAMAVLGESPFTVTLQNWIQVGNHAVWFWLIVALAVLGVGTLLRRNSQLWWIIAWWVAYVAIYHILGVAGFTWYFVPPMMIFYAFVALGIGAVPPLLAKIASLRLIAPAVSIVLLVVIMAGLWRPVRDAHLYRTSGYDGGRYRDYFEVAAWLRRESAPTASVAASEIGILGYESQRPILDTMGLVSPAMRTHLTGWNDTIVYALTHFSPAYIVIINETANDITSAWWFRDYYYPVLELPTITLYGRSQISDEPPYSVETAIQYENGMVLNDVTVESQRAEAGDTLNMWLDVTTASQPQGSYQITTYLVNGVTYERFALNNSIPYDNLYPSSHWQSNDALQIPVRLSLPETIPTGSYQIGVTFYDITNERAIAPTPQIGEEATAQVGWIRVGSPTVPNSALTFNSGSEQYGWADLIVLEQPGVAVVENNEVAVLLPWYALGPITRNLTFFVHLIDHEGDIVAQVDRRPFEGNFPTPVWQVQERLQDIYRLPLPQGLAAGTYQLRVGFYDNNGALRLSSPPEVQGADHVVLQLPVMIPER